MGELAVLTAETSLFWLSPETGHPCSTALIHFTDSSSFFFIYHTIMSHCLWLSPVLLNAVLYSHINKCFTSVTIKTCTDVISPGDDGDDVLYFCHFYYLGLILFSECYIVFWLSGCRNQNETRQKLIKNVYLPV